MSRIKWCFILILFLGCNKNQELKIDCLSFNSVLENGAIVIVPLYGCGGCKSMIFDYFQKINKNPNLICLAYGANNKENRILYGEMFLTDNNIYFDSENCVLNRKNIYPRIILFETGAVIKKIELNPENVIKTLEKFSKSSYSN